MPPISQHRQARWILPSLPEAEISRLADESSIELPAVRVLWKRGLRDAAAIRKFLSPSLDDLHPPHLLKDVDCAAARLQQAITNHERILLYGDYDVDGTTSVVILAKVLQMAGAEVSHHVPNRLTDGYGMHPEVIRKAAAEGVRLIVSVDTGIRAQDVVRLAGELGMDVVITDHHLPETELPPACAVLNPNRPDCGYPNKSLCGAGVTLKLIQALIERLGWTPARQRQVVDSLLKLVAIATVADVVPLVGENRVIVRRGLDGLRQTHNPGLRALLSTAGFADGDRPTAGQIAFRVAPRMNAAGRMADANEVVHLFLTQDPARARSIAMQLHELNQDRQRVEAEIRREIERACLATPITDDQFALVFSGENWHKGVVGIVATRVVETYRRPTFVLSEDPHTGLAQGSGRSIRPFPLLAALESMADLFVKFGGHAQAAGVTLAWDRVNEFRRRLNEFAKERLTRSDMCPVIEVDAPLAIEEINPKSIEEILSLAPFGHGNPAPHFSIPAVQVPAPPDVIKEKHLFLSFAGNGTRLPVKAWNFAARLPELSHGVCYDIVVTIEPDSYAAARGLGEWSAVLKDFRPSSSSER